MSGPTPSAMRTALAELPALPLRQRPKVAVLKTSPAVIPQITSNQSLTPPSTPPKPNNAKASASTDGAGAKRMIGVNRGIELPQIQEGRADLDQADEEQKKQLRVYNKRYDLHEELGYGAWSNVYRATEYLVATATPDIFPLSPPTSPAECNTLSSMAILAIKKPSRRDAHKILANEARILTYLHSHNESARFLVPFHGFDVEHRSIVLDAIPMSLEAYAKSSKKRPLSTKTMFDPVVGAQEWAEMAENLIGGLEFLHNNGCVHGDIKPANILLRPDENQKMLPLYCDFSSSRIASPFTPSEEIEEVSAVTADYTSPELLKSLHQRNNERVVVTFASDVFALAVTLLYAAIGESPYACARVEFQKLGMAKEGIPLEYARLGEQASRIMEGRAVERTLKGALTKDPEKRLKVCGWKLDFVDVKCSWRDKSWLNGG